MLECIDSRRAAGGFTCLLLSLFAVAPAIAQTPAVSTSEPVEISLTPYLWISGLSGTLGLRGQSGSVDASFRDILENVKMGFTGEADVRAGRAVVMTDIAYFRLQTPGSLPAPIDNVADVQADTRQTTWTLNGGYRVVSTPATTVDALAGFRLYDFSVDLDLLHTASNTQRTIAEGDKTWIDPVIGVRLRQVVAPRVFLSAVADVGGFGVSSDSTWQLYLGGGYQVNRRLLLAGGYRYQSVDYDRGGSLYDVANAGFLLGFRFRL